MNRTTLLVIFLFVSVIASTAQDTKPEPVAKSAQAFYAEFGANGVGFSVNYDARFAKSQKGLGYRVGIGLVPGLDFIFFKTSTILTVPVGINYLAGKGPSFFEAGFGVTYVTGKATDFLWSSGDSDEEAKLSAVGFIPSVGYRYAPDGKGFTFRAVISPAFGEGGGAFFGGFSFGVKIN